MGAIEEMFRPPRVDKKNEKQPLSAERIQAPGMWGGGGGIIFHTNIYNHIRQQARQNCSQRCNSYRPGRRHRLTKIKENFTADRSSNAMSYVKFTIVIWNNISKIKDSSLDKAVEAYQASYAKYEKEQTKLLDWIGTQGENKELTKQNWTNTD